MVRAIRESQRTGLLRDCRMVHDPVGHGLGIVVTGIVACHCRDPWETRRAPRRGPAVRHHKIPAWWGRVVYNSIVELFDFGTRRAYHVVERKEGRAGCLRHPGQPLATDPVGHGRLGARPGGAGALAQGVLPAGGRRGAPVPRRACPQDAPAAADGDVHGQATGGRRASWSGGPSPATCGSSGSSRPTPAGRRSVGARRRSALVLGERLRRLDREEVVAFDRIVKRLAGRNGGATGGKSAERPIAFDLHDGSPATSVVAGAGETPCRRSRS